MGNKKANIEEKKQSWRGRKPAKDKKIGFPVYIESSVILANGGVIDGNKIVNLDEFREPILKMLRKKVV